MTVDILIKGGTIIDGTGRPRFQGDVAIQHDKIVAVGTVEDTARHVVDAEGRFVSPGFIDAHTHMDAQLFWEPLGTSPSWHGVTTVVMGNCGFTLAPGRAAEADLAIRSIERAEDISRRAIELGIPWSWETYAEYLDAIDGLSKGINVGGYIGHSALRAFVMGERAFQEPATDDDLAAMRRELAAAIDAGAMGFSTSRSHNHSTFADTPVASRFASWSEVVALVDVLREKEQGIFQLALEHHPGDDVATRGFRQRLRDLAVSSGRPVAFMVGNDQSLLDTLVDFGDHGGQAIGQVNVRPTTSVLSFRTVTPFDRLPLWSTLRNLPIEQKRAMLINADSRRSLVEQAKHAKYEKTLGADARPPDYDRLLILDSAEGPYQSVAQAAEREHVHPIELMIDLALKTDFRQFFVQPYTDLSEEQLYERINHPNTVVSASDAGAHISQIMDSAIPTYLLSHWVRRTERFTWEQAVHKLTGDLAAKWSIESRGRLEAGWQADVVVFDPETVRPEMPQIVSDLPDGGPRLIQEAIGINTVIVNGEIFMNDGEPTQARAGRLLRGGSSG